ncbi:hypothetical protein JXJ21_10240 [candidate division KSB1 bacterium]|nr:hypothetical protein [candidate division KSB1 bacterium]
MHRLKALHIYLSLAVILSLILVLGGCSHEGENVPTAFPTVLSELDAGWASFKKAQYENAITHFTNARDRDAAKIEAYNGLGWSNTRLGNYMVSEQNFMLMLTLSDDVNVKADGMAGLAYNNFATPIDLTEVDAAIRDSIAIDYAQQALELRSDYQFEHDSNINSRMLNVLIAECRFNRKEYLSALTVIDENLENNFIQSLASSGVLGEVIDDTIQVAVLNETQLTGRAKMTIEAELVRINSIKNLDQNTTYSVESFDEGGNTVIFIGNPIPQKNELFLVSYYHAPNYGKFLAVLMQKLQAL